MINEYEELHEISKKQTFVKSTGKKFMETIQMRCRINDIQGIISALKDYVDTHSDEENMQDILSEFIALENLIRGKQKDRRLRTTSSEG